MAEGKENDGDKSNINQISNYRTWTCLVYGWGKAKHKMQRSSMHLDKVLRFFSKVENGFN